MDQETQRNLARLQAIVAELPPYLQSGSLFTNTVIDSAAGPRENYPVSISGALDLVQQLQSSTGLSPEMKAEVSSLDTRLQSIKRFYPDAWKDKLNRELRSRAAGLKWTAEDAAREKRAGNREDATFTARANRMRRIIDAARGDVDVTPYQQALDKAAAESDEGEA